MATPAPVGDIPDQPHDHNFPKHEFGQISLPIFSKFLVWQMEMDALCMYNATSDLAFYHFCMSQINWVVPVN